MALTIGNWQIIDHIVGLPPITQRDTTQQAQLGLIVRARDIGNTNYGVGEFIYVKGVASCAAKDWVVIPPDTYTIARAAADAEGPLGIAMAALTASYYGWAQIGGKAIGNCLTSFADNGDVYLTSTAGSVDDASVAGDHIMGAFGASSAVTGDLHAEFELSRPFAPHRVTTAGS
jgi:hypothetical protein